MNTIVKKSLWGILGMAMICSIFLLGESKAGAEGATPLPTPTKAVTLPHYYSEMITSGIYSYRFINEEKTKIAILGIDTNEEKLVIPSQMMNSK